jgi:SpoIIAA-like
VLIPRLELIIREYGKARLLLDMGDFHGWEAAAMWDDTRFGLTHRNDFEKMGVIGGPGWGVINRYRSKSRKGGSSRPKAKSTGRPANE